MRILLLQIHSPAGWAVVASMPTPVQDRARQVEIGSIGRLNKSIKHSTTAVSQLTSGIRVSTYMISLTRPTMPFSNMTLMP